MRVLQGCCDEAQEQQEAIQAGAFQKYTALLVAGSCPYSLKHVHACLAGLCHEAQEQQEAIQAV
jgi:hypothetical protein